MEAKANKYILIIIKIFRFLLILHFCFSVPLIAFSESESCRLMRINCEQPSVYTSDGENKCDCINPTQSNTDSEETKNFYRNLEGNTNCSNTGGTWDEVSFTCKIGNIDVPDHCIAVAAGNAHPAGQSQDCINAREAVMNDKDHNPQPKDPICEDGQVDDGNGGCEDDTTADSNEEPACDPDTDDDCPADTEEVSNDGDGEAEELEDIQEQKRAEASNAMVACKTAYVAADGTCNAQGDNLMQLFAKENYEVYQRISAFRNTAQDASQLRTACENIGSLSQDFKKIVDWHGFSCNALKATCTLACGHAKGKAQIPAPNLYQEATALNQQCNSYRASSAAASRSIAEVDAFSQRCLAITNNPCAKDPESQDCKAYCAANENAMGCSEVVEEPEPIPPPAVPEPEPTVEFCQNENNATSPKCVAAKRCADPASPDPYCCQFGSTGPQCGGLNVSEKPNTPRCQGPNCGNAPLDPGEEDGEAYDPLAALLPSRGGGSPKAGGGVGGTGGGGSGGGGGGGSGGGGGNKGRQAGRGRGRYPSKRKSIISGVDRRKSTGRSGGGKSGGGGGSGGVASKAKPVAKLAEKKKNDKFDLKKYLPGSIKNFLGIKDRGLASDFSPVGIDGITGANGPTIFRKINKGYDRYERKIDAYNKRSKRKK